MKLRLNDPMPVVLFLEPSDTDKSPIASAFDVDRKVLWQSGMQHQSSGMYYVDGYTMPNSNVVRVVYDVPDALVESDGVLVRKYARAEDIFELENTPTKSDVLDTMQHKGFIIGKLVKSVRYPGFTLGVMK